MESVEHTEKARQAYEYVKRTWNAEAAFATRTFAALGKLARHMWNKEEAAWAIGGAAEALCMVGAAVEYRCIARSELTYFLEGLYNVKETERNVRRGALEYGWAEWRGFQLIAVGDKEVAEFRAHIEEQHRKEVEGEYAERAKKMKERYEKEHAEQAETLEDSGAGSGTGGAGDGDGGKGTDP